MKDLRETVAMMESANYKNRFRAEYWQTKIRYKKLHTMINKHKAGKLDFTPTCPIELLEQQKSFMGRYLNCLEIRAEMEGIDLNSNEEEAELTRIINMQVTTIHKDKAKTIDGIVNLKSESKKIIADHMAEYFKADDIKIAIQDFVRDGV